MFLPNRCNVCYINAYTQAVCSGTIWEDVEKKCAVTSSTLRKHMQRYCPGEPITAVERAAVQIPKFLADVWRSKWGAVHTAPVDSLFLLNQFKGLHMLPDGFTVGEQGCPQELYNKMQSQTEQQYLAAVEQASRARADWLEHTRRREEELEENAVRLLDAAQAALTRQQLTYSGDNDSSSNNDSSSVDGAPSPKRPRMSSPSHLVECEAEVALRRRKLDELLAAHAARRAAELPDIRSCLLAEPPITCHTRFETIYTTTCQECGTESRREHEQTALRISSITQRGIVFEAPPPASGGGDGGSGGRRAQRVAFRDGQPVIQTVATNSLTSVLAQYGSPEEVLHGRDAYMCDTCGSKQTATRTEHLQTLPQLLVVQLSFRIQNPGHVARVDKSEFMFPLSWETGGESIMVYNLVSVVAFRGIISGAGHYVAYYRSHVTGEWFYASDEETIIINQDEFLLELDGRLKRDAFMLFYLRSS